MLVILIILGKTRKSRYTKVQTKITQTWQSEHGIQIGHKETYTEYTMDCSLDSQDNLTQEEGKHRVKYIRER